MGQELPTSAPQPTGLQGLITDAGYPMLVLSASGHIVYANRAVETLLGYRQGELQNQPLDALLTAPSAEAMTSSFATLASTAQGSRLDIEVRHKTGRTLDLEAMLVPTTLFALSSHSPTDVFVILRDITVEKRAQERQQTLIQGLRTVLGSAAELMACPDLEHTYRRAVEFTREELGIERCALFLINAQGLIGGTYGTNMRGETMDEHGNGFQMWPHNLVPAEWYETTSPREAHWTSSEGTWYEWNDGKAVATGEGWICHSPIHSTTGLIGIMSNDAAISGAPLDEVKQEVLSVFCSLLGKIIERKRYEDDIRRALEKEHELGDLKSRLIQSVSHEFRTPFAVILTSTHVLHHYSNQISAERAANHWDTIEYQIAHMTNMLDELLTIEKMDQRRFTFNPTPVDLIGFCSSLAQRFTIRAAPKHQIEFTAQGDQAIRLIDEWLLNQILVNLLSNAINYSPAGGPIKLALTCTPDAIELRVTDTGIGISAEDRDHVFELFHRGRNAETIHGIGLGLSIVQRAVLAHEGQISFASQEGAGTTFIVTLPTRQISA